LGNNLQIAYEIIWIIAWIIVLEIAWIKHEINLP